MSTLAYFLTASLYLLLFFGCYVLLLRRTTFFGLNRAYLLLAHLYGYLWRQRFERRETDARLARHLARRDGR